MNHCPYNNATLTERAYFFFPRRILSEISVYYKLKCKREMVCYYFILLSPYMFVIYSLSLCIAFLTLAAEEKSQWAGSNLSVACGTVSRDTTAFHRLFCLRCLTNDCEMRLAPSSFSFLKWRSEGEGCIFNLLPRAHSRHQ